MLESGEGVYFEYVFVVGYFGQFFVVYFVVYVDRVDFYVLFFQFGCFFLGFFFVSGVIVCDYNGDFWDVGIGLIIYNDVMLLVRQGFSLNDV